MAEKKIEFKYTPKEQQNWHYQKSLKGAVEYDRDGNQYQISDFARGMHRQRSIEIQKARTRTWRKHNAK